MKKISKLSLFVLPLLLAGCSNGQESKQYQAINDQQTIMKDYYRQHTINQSNLNIYNFNYSLNYDPTYDVFGSLATRIGTEKTLPKLENAKGFYFDAKVVSEVGVYSGYFIANSTSTIYTGNKQNVGSVDTIEVGESYWFRNFDDAGHDGTQELIHRIEVKDNDLEPVVRDFKTGTAVENDNVQHYFSNNINADYSDYFDRSLSQPIPAAPMYVSAYRKSDTEIVETYKETKNVDPIENPIHPGEEHMLAVLKQTSGETTFRYLEKIGWAGTSFKETITYSLVSDYELKLLNEPRVILSETTEMTFTYSTSIQPYSGEAFVYQKEDDNIQKFTPMMFSFDGETHHLVDVEVANVTYEYKKLHPEFSGYAYSFNPIVLEAGVAYSFTCQEDYDNSNYEAIGALQVIGNAGGTIISASVEGHNLIKTITTSETYEFIVLVSSTGSKSLIAHLYH